MSIPNCRRIVSGVALLAAALVFAASSAQATVIDLTTLNAEGTSNGAIFQQGDFSSAGTGFIDPFLRVQNNGTEQGFNTSHTPPPLDDKAGHVRDVTFAELITTEVTLSGTNYFKFGLDIDQANPTTLSLVTLQIYTAHTGGLATLSDLTSQGTLRYQMAPTDSVLLDASLSSGSGQGDMFLYVPVSDFAGVSSSDFVYLYCLFGDEAHPSNAGPEEWSLVVNPIPEASTIFPIVGLFAAVFSTQFIRRRQQQRISK
jgi:hypothetical protein